MFGLFPVQKVPHAHCGRGIISAAEAEGSVFKLFLENNAAERVVALQIGGINLHDNGGIRIAFAAGMIAHAVCNNLIFAEEDATTTPPGHMQKVYTPRLPLLPVNLYSAAPRRDVLQTVRIVND